MSYDDLTPMALGNTLFGVFAGPRRRPLEESLIDHPFCACYVDIMFECNGRWTKSELSDRDADILVKMSKRMLPSAERACEALPWLLTPKMDPLECAL